MLLHGTARKAVPPKPDQMMEGRWRARSWRSRRCRTAVDAPDDERTVYVHTDQGPISAALTRGAEIGRASPCRCLA